MFASVQDHGRLGYRDLGVPTGGVMDKELAMLANSTLGNKESAACIEFASPGPVLRFLEPTRIFLSGFGLKPQLNGREIRSAEVIDIKSGDVMDTGRFNGCFWSYLAVRGGIGSEVVLGSRSQHAGLTAKARLLRGSKYDISNEWNVNKTDGKVNSRLRLSKQGSFIVAYPGPEFGLLSGKDRKLLETEFKVGKASNRMAYNLEHSLFISAKEILTAPVQPGTIQLTPSGGLIALMRDAQTTGGYARVLQLSDKSIAQLARLPVNQLSRFRIERLQLRDQF